MLNELLRRFTQVYCNSDGEVRCGDLLARCSNEAGRIIESTAQIDYQELLPSFSEDCLIDKNMLVKSLVNTDPLLRVQHVDEEDGLDQHFSYVLKMFVADCAECNGADGPRKKKMYRTFETVSVA